MPKRGFGWKSSKLFASFKVLQGCFSLFAMMKHSASSLKCWFRYPKTFIRSWSYSSLSALFSSWSPMYSKVATHSKATNTWGHSQSLSTTCKLLEIQLEIWPSPSMESGSNQKRLATIRWTRMVTWRTDTSMLSSRSSGSSSSPTFSLCKLFYLTFWSLKFQWLTKQLKALDRAFCTKKSKSSTSLSRR